MNQMLMGAIAVASLVAGLFFFRFWRHTRDLFFLFFALSFWLEAANRIALGLLVGADEDGALFYSVRVVAYGLILVAIWHKNRPAADAGTWHDPSPASLVSSARYVLRYDQAQVRRLSADSRQDVQGDLAVRGLRWLASPGGRDVAIRVTQFPAL